MNKRLLGLTVITTGAFIAATSHGNTAQPAMRFESLPVMPAVVMPLIPTTTITIATSTATSTTSTTVMPGSTTTVRIIPVLKPQTVKPQTVKQPPAVVAQGFRCPTAVAALQRAGAAPASLPHWDFLAWRESRCVLSAHHPLGAFCWWQVFYGNGLWALRTKQFGDPYNLLHDGDACARAALTLYGESGWHPWDT